MEDICDQFIFLQNWICIKKVTRQAEGHLNNKAQRPLGIGLEEYYNKNLIMISLKRCTLLNFELYPIFGSYW